MAFNPVLAESGCKEPLLIPFSLQGERQVLWRRGMSLDMKVGNDKYKGDGYVFLTTYRLVFVKKGDLKSHSKFSSCEFPLATMIHSQSAGQAPEFKQPVFGANYLEGDTPPLQGARWPFGMNCRWSLTFKEGGCAKFVKLFYGLQRAAKKSDEAAQRQADQLFAGDVAYLDPSDPSVIFVQQPIPQQTFEWTQNGYRPMQAPPQQHQPIGLIQPTPALGGAHSPLPVGALPVYQAYPPGQYQQPPGAYTPSPYGLPPGYYYQLPGPSGYPQMPPGHPQMPSGHYYLPPQGYFYAAPPGHPGIHPPPQQGMMLLAQDQGGQPQQYQPQAQFQGQQTEQQPRPLPAFGAYQPDADEEEDFNLTGAQRQGTLSPSRVRRMPEEQQELLPARVLAGERVTQAVNELEGRSPVSK